MNLSLSVLRHLIKGKARCNNTNRYTQWYDDLCAERDMVLGVFESRQNVKCNFEISKMKYPHSLFIGKYSYWNQNFGEPVISEPGTGEPGTGSREPYGGNQGTGSGNQFPGSRVVPPVVPLWFPGTREPVPGNRFPGSPKVPPCGSREPYRGNQGTREPVPWFPGSPGTQVPRYPGPRTGTQEQEKSRERATTAPHDKHKSVQSRGAFMH